MKKVLLHTLLVLAIAGVCGEACAQTTSGEPAYPTKPIRVVVPFSPGSATDTIARIIGTKLVEKWGRPVVTDNRPSAGGIIAGSIVLEANPDGHTLMASGSSFSGTAALYSKLPYDSIKDFAGITEIGTTPLVFVVASTLGVNSLNELIALAQQKPGQLTFGSGGIGTGNHYATELFNLTVGIKGVHVPYRGTADALTDSVAGRLHYFLSPVLPAVPMIKNKRLLALAVTTTQRLPPLPDVPTVAEAGVAGFGYVGWYGLLASRKTPRNIVNLLSREVGRILELPDVKERIANQGAAAQRSTPEELDKLIRDDIETRKKVWKAAGVKAE